MYCIFQDRRLTLLLRSAWAASFLLAVPQLFIFSMKASNPVVMVQASERLMTCMSRHAKGSLPTDACRTGRLAHTHAGTQVAPCRCASAETLASAFVASPQSLDVPMPP